METKKKSKEEIVAAMHTRQLRAVVLRHSGMTLAEVGKELSVTGERARQIVYRGSREIRNTLHPEKKEHFQLL